MCYKAPSLRQLKASYYKNACINDTIMKPYTPIHCNQYDKLEALSVLKQKVNIHFLNDTGETQEVFDQIKDLKTIAGVEYLWTTQTDLKLRLDQLISVDLEQFGGTCSI